MKIDCKWTKKTELFWECFNCFKFDVQRQIRSCWTHFRNQHFRTHDPEECLWVVRFADPWADYWKFEWSFHQWRLGSFLLNYCLDDRVSGPCSFGHWWLVLFFDRSRTDSYWTFGPIVVRCTTVSLFLKLWAENGRSCWNIWGFWRLLAGAWKMLLFAADTPEVLSACRWRIFISPLYFFSNSFKCNKIFSSVVLSYGRGRLCAYCPRSVLHSAFEPNFAISLFRALTSGTFGSSITVVVGELRTTVLPGANVSHRLRRSLLDFFVTFLANFSSSEVSIPGIGLESFNWNMERDTALFFSPLYLQPASNWALFMASSMRINNDIEMVHKKDLKILGLYLYYRVVFLIFLQCVLGKVLHLVSFVCIYAIDIILTLFRL